jgi:hypothetical protein
MEVLKKEGFENIRILNEGNCWAVTVENPVYRWNVTAIIKAMEILSRESGETGRVKLLMLEKDIPRILVEFNPAEWLRYTCGELPADSMANLIKITENTEEAWKMIRDERPERRNSGKTDLVIYPQFSFENTLKARLYTSQLNIAPALSLNLLRGMHVTGQVIFPLYNEMGYEGDFIRPGQILLSQDFKHRKLSGRMALGNFSSNRWGGDLRLRYILPDEDWSVKFNAGLTGSSHYLDHKIKLSSPSTVTWSVSATWFISRFNLEAEGGFHRYIYGDAGVYGTLTRWFGETAFGFYALAGRESVNGGFRFCFPFPVKKRPRNHFFRVTLPDYQDMVYNAGTEFYYGQTYQAGLETNMINGFYRAAWLKREILRRGNE